MSRAHAAFLLCGVAWGTCSPAEAGQTGFGTSTGPQTSLTTYEADIRAGAGFVASAPTLQVGSTNTYYFELCNAAGSGRKAIVYKRRFDNSQVGGTVPVSYGGMSNPSAIASPTTTSKGSNLITGGAASSAVTFTAASLANNTLSGTITATGFLPTNGIALKLEEPRIILPGVCFANFVLGAGQSGTGLTGNVQIGMTLYWVEESYP